MVKKTKRPSLALRKQLKPLIDAATKGLILSGPTTEGQGAYPQVIVVWPVTEVGGSTPVMPEGFPRGYVLERDAYKVKMKHDCKKLVNWFYNNLYITYNARDIMKARQGIVVGLHYLEKDLYDMLDVDKEFVYNDGIK